MELKGIYGCVYVMGTSASKRNVRGVVASCLIRRDN